MTKIIKNLLGIALVISVLAIGYAAVNYVNYYGKAIKPSSFRNFSVTAKAKVSAIPDVAEFNFQVINEGNKDLASIQKDNTNISNKLINFLTTQGVAKQDIKTNSYNVSPRYQTSNCKISVKPLNSDKTNILINSSQQTCPPPSIVGYTITQSINVKIHDFSKIGNIMSGLIKNGANKVGSLSFTINDLSKLQDEARTKAIAKAEIKAKSIAKAGGFTVGRLLNIQENSPYPIYRPLMLRTANGQNETNSLAPTIQPGSQDVSVNVTLQYEIK